MSEGQRDDTAAADDGGGYDEEQRRRFIDAASEVLVAAVAAEPTGPISYFREVLAAGRYLYDARRTYAHNALVQQVFSRSEDRPVELEQVTKESLLRSIREVGATVRDDEEGTEFKAFLFELARRVTRASRSGWFGPRLAPDEATFLRELRTALGLDPA